MKKITPMIVNLFFKDQLTLHAYVEVYVQGRHYQEGRTDETFGHSIQHVKKADEAQEDADELRTFPRGI